MYMCVQHSHIHYPISFATNNPNILPWTLRAQTNRHAHTNLRAAVLGLSMPPERFCNNTAMRTARCHRSDQALANSWP